MPPMSDKSDVWYAAEIRRRVQDLNDLINQATKTGLSIRIEKMSIGTVENPHVVLLNCEIHRITKI